MTGLYDWAFRHNISYEALDDLMQVMGVGPSDPISANHTPKSEAAVQAELRLTASKQGDRLFRNNVGVLKNEAGIPVRYGLCNESKQVNKKFKSSDLIGIKKVLITPYMVGKTIGQFAAIETKHEEWEWSGTEREKGQLNFIKLINSLGGHARFATRGNIF